MKLVIQTAVLAGAATLVVACAPEVRTGTGARDYAQFCASCHGADGRGNGPALAGLSPRPNDLTTIRARNGGTFPRLQVMGWIAGHTMGRSDSHMPQFGDWLEQGGTVIHDAGDGNPAPTPARLVGLVDYLETIQR